MPEPGAKAPPEAGSPNPSYKVDLAEMDKRFTYHAPKGDQPVRYAEIRVVAKELATMMCSRVPPGRELSLAITNIEQAVMWANAGIARNE